MVWYGMVWYGMVGNVRTGYGCKKVIKKKRTMGVGVRANLQPACDHTLFCSLSENSPAGHQPTPRVV